MDIPRRDLVGAGLGLGAAALVGAMTSPASAAVETRMGGIHIYCLLKVVSPAALNGFPFSVMFVLWGPDSALNGMGWGATTEGGDAVQTYLGASVLPRVFAAGGSVEGDLVKLEAVPIFSGARAGQGLPWRVEADFATGAVRGVEVNAQMGTEFILEGKGVVARI